MLAQIDQGAERGVDLAAYSTIRYRGMDLTLVWRLLSCSSALHLDWSWIAPLILRLFYLLDRDAENKGILPS